MLTPILREAHRLRRLIRDSQAEIDKAPKALKAQQAKLALAEKTLADAKEELKKRKAGNLTAEATIKSLNQNLARHEKQLDTLTEPRQIEAKEHDIANTKALIGTTEDELMAGMIDVDERTAKLPEQEAALAKAKADFAKWETESAERLERLKREVMESTKLLAETDAKIPEAVKGQYDRLIKAYGADGLAGVDHSTCSQCRMAITAQQTTELGKGTEFICCRSCGRGLYQAG